MNKTEFKLALIDALAENNDFFKRAPNDWYRLRCPFCGDSESNLNTGHLYMKINPNDNYKIGYNCFRCEEHGSLRPDQLELFNVDTKEFRECLAIVNKTSDVADKKNLSMEEKFTMFDYTIPDVVREQDRKKIKYIEDRLGITIDGQRMQELKIVTSLRDFLIHNGIKKITCQPDLAWAYEDHYVGFLSHGNSHILLRDITETEEHRWVKYPITAESSTNKLFYSMAAEINPMTTEPLVINLAEGVMDIASASYNLGYYGSNCINLCVTGKYYNSLLLYLIDLGLVGSNITVNIFADNDEKFNKKSKGKTTIEYFKKALGRYKYLYKEINIFYNTLSKDIGVTREKICLKKEKL